MVESIQLRKIFKKTLLEPRSLKLFMFFVFLLSRIKPNPTFKFDLKNSGTSFPLNCGTSTKTLFFKLRTKEKTGKPISIKIVSESLNESDKYITDSSGSIKRYGVYQTGTNCFFHTERTGININPVVILVIQNNGASSNKCQIVRIISNLGLQACGATDTEEFSNVVQLMTEANSVGTSTSFDSLKLSNGFHYEAEGPLLLEFLNFDVPDIDERIIEALLIQPMSDTIKYKLVTVVNQAALKEVNDYLSLNQFASETKTEGVLKRVVRDDYPGYYLDVYNGGNDDTSKFGQRVHSTAVKTGHSVQWEFYIAKAASIGLGEVHWVELSSKGWRKKSNKQSKYAELLYNVEVRRTSSHLDFQVKRGQDVIPSLSTSFPYTGGEEFIYFCLTVGAEYFI